MNEAGISCPMCGHQFDPQAHRACSACPVQHGCSMVCCPQCGYQTVDPGQSRLARWVSQWLPGIGSAEGANIQPDEPWSEGR